MGLFKNLRGTLESFFNIGGPTGPALKDNSGVIQARNFDDTAYARVQGASPTDDNDLVTKKYADTLSKPLIVARQADTSVALPTNTASRGLVVVTTAGTGAAIGDLLFDDGSGSGNMEILTAVNGRTIATTVALTGGTVEFEADSIYLWDSDGSSGSVQWVKIGDVGAVTGAERLIRFAIGTATVDSSTTIPANARILRCDVDITTAYNGGATISIGVAGGTVDLIQTTSDNNPQAGGVPNTYAKEQDTAWGGSTAAVRATLTGASSGVGVVRVFYSQANS